MLLNGYYVANTANTHLFALLTSNMCFYISVCSKGTYIDYRINSRQSKLSARSRWGGGGGNAASHSVSIIGNIFFSGG